jgi:hypothetical protein
VGWRYEWRDDAYTKPLICVQTGHHASTTDPHTWTTCEIALRSYHDATHRLDGIGYVLTEADGIVGFDLDHCRNPDTGEIDPWALDLTHRLNSYTEVSPSGTGLRTLTRGTFTDSKQGRRQGDLEMYRGQRYLTLTGCHLDGTPTTIEPRQDAIDAIYAQFFRRPERPPDASRTNGHPPMLEDAALLEKALSARNGGKLARLLAGDIRGYPSPSEADLALCFVLAFWTQDVRQIDRLVRGSALFREKWERPDYREATITKALAETTEHWTPLRVESNGKGPIALGEEKKAWQDKPVIQLSTNLTTMADALQDAIRALPDGPRLFQRARQLCLIGRGTKPPKWLRRPAEAPVILPIIPAYLRELANQAALWKKFDKRAKGWDDVLPPMWIIDTLVARPSWPFPLLEGVICTPTLRPDGTILMTPGYDTDTGLYLDINGTIYPPIRNRPTLDDARTAIGRLHEPFHDFPFAAPYHLSTTFAAILSLVARYAIQGNVPLIAVRATTRGAGKGLLIDAIHVIATGRQAPRWAQTTDEEEERKRLLTIALAGDAAIHIDNVTAPLGSAPLDLALTAPTFSDRILGTQQSREAPMHAVFFASGNNMVFQGDMARRVVPIDLDPQMERPEERDNFRYTPLLSWVLKERPALVTAALTILKAYFEAGCPLQHIKPLGSFEEWSTLVRQALIWAGEADPCAGREHIEAESDPEYETLNSLLMAWYARYGTTTRTVKQLKEDLDIHTVYDNDARRLVIHPEWRDLQSTLASLDKRGSEVNVQAIGKALRSWKGRMVEGKRLVMAGEDSHSKVKMWRVICN